MTLPALAAWFLSLSLAAEVPSDNHRDVPEGVSIKGEVVMGKTWKDSQGEHVVVLTSLSRRNRRDDSRSAFLYGGHWRKGTGAWEAIWRMSDRVEECQEDISCQFAPGSLEITDLDGNGVAEVSFLYRLACRGDISPDDQKFLLYEGSRKHAMRGTEKVILPSDDGDEIMGGEYKVDRAFRRAPAAFLAFAREQWAKLGVRKY